MEHATMPVGAGGRDPRPFLREAVAAATRREARIPLLLLLILLTATNIVILFHLPAANATPSLPFVLAAAVRILGLFVIALAILRAAAASPRPKWRLDGAFWLYTLVAPLGFAVSFLVMALVGDSSDPAGMLLANILNTLILAPFAAWLGAIAVARPLAWNPLDWVRGFGAWLGPLLLWSLLLVTPMAILHAIIDLRLIAGVGQWFWPLALFDGALSTVMAALALGLNVVAYRRVAQG